MTTIEHQREIVYGKNFTFKPRGMVFDEQSQELLKLVQSIYHDDRQLTNWSYIPTSSSSFNDPRNLKLTNSTTLLLSTTHEGKQLLGLFHRYGFEMVAEKFLQEDDEKSYLFLQIGMPELRDMAQVYYADDFKNIHIKQMGKVSAGVKINRKIPIIKDQDEKALIELRRSIKPFIMRRMKKAVLKELPKKIESKMINEITLEQTQFYAA